jgi:hypothetical protein
LLPPYDESHGTRFRALHRSYALGRIWAARSTNAHAPKLIVISSVE